MMRKWSFPLYLVTFTALLSLLPSSEQHRKHKIFPNISRRFGNVTRHVDLIDKNAEIFANIVESLEKLNILSSSKTRCYTLKKIVREIASPENKMIRKRTIGIYLYFEENLIVDSHAKIITIDKERNAVYNTSNSNGVSIHGDRLSVKNNRTKTDCTSTKILADKTRPTVIGTEAQNATMINTTLVDGGAFANGDEQGLSRTQVVVISTCSTVIGTFFLVAGIMRLRNYIKRVQIEHTVNRRAAAAGTYRQQGMVPQCKAGVGVSGDSIRQDPLSQKQNKQAIAPKRELHMPLSNGEGRRGKTSFTNPTLLVTTPSTPSLRVPSDDSMVKPREEETIDDDNGADDDAHESSPLLKQPADDSVMNVQQDPLLLKHLSEVVGADIVPENINPDEVDLVRRQSFPVMTDSAFEKPKFVFPRQRTESADTKCLQRQYCMDRGMIGGGPKSPHDTGGKELLVSLKNCVSDGHSIDTRCDDSVEQLVYSPITSGLCQSDRSLSSLGQPSYNYGYQTEYTDTPGYFQQAYHSGENVIVDIREDSEPVIDNSKPSHVKKLLHCISMTEFVTDKSVKSHMIESFDYPSPQASRPLVYQDSFDFGGSPETQDPKVYRYRNSFDFGPSTDVSEKKPMIRREMKYRDSFDFGSETRTMDQVRFQQLENIQSDSIPGTVTDASIQPSPLGMNMGQPHGDSSVTFNQAHAQRQKRPNSRRSRLSFSSLAEEEHDTENSSSTSESATIVNNKMTTTGCETKSNLSDKSDDQISTSSLEQSCCVLPHDACNVSLDGASNVTDSSACIVSLSDGSYTLSPSSDSTPHMSDIESISEELEGDGCNSPEKGDAGAVGLCVDVTKKKQSFELLLDRENDSSNHSGSSSSQTPTKTKEQLQHLLLNDNVKATFV